ncbi:hypothetical protein TNCT_198991 [Trichonephila clavata]|uniref:Uncharacterized protein n=1 Tax=Trichonephila clavata TaxID=2740835 RepID=A0A8X6LW37_TRICU|nr:hypothetical protein TNCT_198991 [Trichonephila clavata]
MENFENINIDYITREGVNLISVCNEIRAARRKFKDLVKILMFCDACLQTLIRSSQEEFMSALQGANFVGNLWMLINEYLQHARSLMLRIERARNFLSGTVDHREFLPPAREKFRRLKSRFLITETQINLWLPYVVDRYFSE